MSDPIRTRSTPLVRDGGGAAPTPAADATQRVRFSDLLHQRRPASAAPGLEPGAPDGTADAATGDAPAPDVQPRGPQGTQGPPMGPAQPGGLAEPGWPGSAAPPRPERGLRGNRERRGGQEGDGGEPKARASGTGVARAGGHEHSPALQRLANAVAGFCNDRGVADSEDWRVRIELDDELFPDTTLDLALSSHLLALRFEAQDEGSRRLLSAHRSDLAAHLEGTLARRREVTIDVA